MTAKKTAEYGTDARSQNARIRLIHQTSLAEYGFGIRAARSIKVCPCCGATADAACRRCGQCGSPLPRLNLYETVTQRKPHCPGCGAVLSGREHYCPACGQQLLPPPDPAADCG